MHCFVQYIKDLSLTNILSAAWLKTQLREQIWRCLWLVLHPFFWINWFPHYSFLCWWLLQVEVSILVAESHVHQAIRGGGSRLCWLVVQNHGSEPAQHSHPWHRLIEAPPPADTFLGLSSFTYRYCAHMYMVHNACWHFFFSSLLGFIFSSFSRLAPAAGPVESLLYCKTTASPPRCR